MQHRSHVSLLKIANLYLLTTAPMAQNGRDPQLAFRLARKSHDLKPDFRAAHLALAAASYRNEDWTGCISAGEKEPDQAGYYLAMACLQLGDRTRHSLVSASAAGAWLTRFAAERPNGSSRGGDTYSVSTLRRVRTEAAALLGVK